MESMVSPLMHLKGSVSNPFLITILGSIVTATALTVYHFILVRYCIGRHVTTTTATSEQPTPVHDLPGAGVDEKVLAAIPIIVFSDLDHDHHQEEEECVVCLGELEGDDLVRLLPNCKHAFHVACIDTWLGAHTTCPLCRSPVPGEIDLEPVGRSRDPAYLQNSNDEGSTSLDSGGDLSSPRASGSLGLLRHCASVVFQPPERTLPRLKRSLSMDQSLVVIDMRRADNCSSNSPSSSRNDRMRGSSCSTSHFDRVSSKLFRSLSWLRVGRGSSSSSILPY